jgi:hypothetical protein
LRGRRGTYLDKRACATKIRQGALIIQILYGECIGGGVATEVTDKILGAEWDFKNSTTILQTVSKKRKTMHSSQGNRAP